MKRILILTLCLIPFLLNAQNNQGGHGDKRPMSEQRQRINQLEKIKLIELLNLNEEKAVKFFARRNDQRNAYMKLMGDYSDAIDALEKEIKSGKKTGENFYKTEVKKILNIENEMLNSRKSFYFSLKDILTQEQIAKFIVFEIRFREEMRREMMQDRDKNKK